VALLTSYPPFLDVLWTMAVFFAWVVWFWLLITVFADVFRRHDVGGGTKVLWLIFVIILPYLGVLIYLLANNEGIAERRMRDAQVAQQPTRARVSSAAPATGAAEIERAKHLLDSGAITQPEFDGLKAKALAM
jgi:hypothetical protein